jgi:hypothetical protein
MVLVVVEVSVVVDAGCDAVIVAVLVTVDAGPVTV